MQSIKCAFSWYWICRQRFQTESMMMFYQWRHSKYNKSFDVISWIGLNWWRKTARILWIMPILMIKMMNRTGCLADSWEFVVRHRNTFFWDCNWILYALAMPAHLIYIRINTKHHQLFVSMQIGIVSEHWLRICFDINIR